MTLQILIIGIKIALWQDCVEAAYTDAECEQCDSIVTLNEWNTWWEARND
jgi:hypothetical protein